MRLATDEVLRITDRAALFDDVEICERRSAEGKPATLANCIEVESAAFPCVRSARRAGLWDPAQWDAPTRISFRQIYAEALGDPAIKPLFDRLTEMSDVTLY